MPLNKETETKVERSGCFGDPILCRTWTNRSFIIHTHTHIYIACGLFEAYRVGGPHLCNGTTVSVASRFLWGAYACPTPPRF